ncbi:MAG: class I SAM-dependent RNA methyltransferase [Hungatella sp.]|nr:class I SAM-dependent RNA methyltransferase [Hungatella sp.]MCI9503341.1 class I SAM-dependent RNA methyltransferase [Hungatella sp.]
MKKTFELIAPCHFGLEAVLKKEIIDLGYDITQVEDGRVTFLGDGEAICRANVFLRTAERVLLKAGSFRAETFDELFENTRAIPWEELIPQDGKFWVAKASSIKSKLFSPSDIQRIMKKAMVERLKSARGISVLPETGSSYVLRVFLYKDQVTVGIDTSGDSLHKRGYRTLISKAPITETLAAALILLTPWKKDRILVDPFCGSGTFPIEAAMMAANMAPGMNRSFLAEEWSNLIGKKCWYDTLDEANDLVDREAQADIQGYDIDGDIVRAARANAEAAGVGHMIHFQQRPVSALSHPKKYGFLIANPPYGERIEGKENLPGLYRELGERMRALDSWSAYIITAYEDAEKYIGRKADKNRKIYNGMMKTYFYQFMGPKPPSRNRSRAESL